MNLCAYQHRRSKAMLGNTWLATKEELESARLSGRQRKGTTESKEPPCFPEEHFERLLLEGFLVGRKHSLREILIVLLLHCGGFRESEPFHLFAGDVIPDPDNYLKAMVLIHHPQRGLAPSDWRDEKGRPIHGNRRDYLQAKFGMLPRNEILGTCHAGWKPRIHEAEYGSEFLRTYWFEPWWGEFFLAVWYKYLAQILVLERNHPFAFVNIGRAPIGDMYKVGKFNDAHADAVSRIGLEVSKAAGTTPHGHRHAYAQRLRKGKVDENLVRRAMHHSSVASQKIYTAPSLDEVMRCLHEATANLDRSASASSHKLMEIIIH